MSACVFARSSSCGVRFFTVPLVAMGRKRGVVRMLWRVLSSPVRAAVFVSSLVIVNIVIEPYRIFQRICSGCGIRRGMRG